MQTIVVDRTGLSGRFDFIPEWSRDSMRAPTDTSPDPEPFPPLPIALEQQLGLKLVAEKGKKTILVIDHLERPSEN